MFKPVLTSAATQETSAVSTLPLDAGSIESAIQGRISFLTTSINAGAISGLNPKLAGYKIVGAALKNQDDASHRAKLANMISTANGGDGEMFALPCYARYLHQFGPRMTTPEADAIKSALAAQTHELFGHGTLNHAAMQCLSYYLLAQYYPDVIWTDKSAGTWTSAQVMATNKANWLRRWARFSENGSHAEITSSTYSIVNLMCVLNIVDFCQDAQLKAVAEKEAALYLATIKANSHHGNIVAPILRRNYEQLNAPDSPETYIPSVGQHILWFYYGEPSTSAYDLSGDREPLFASMLAASAWRPPVATYKQEFGARFMTIPSFSQWDGQTTPQLMASNYIADDFAIGCANAIFDPAGYTAWQTFSINAKSSAPQNQISCYHPYYDSNSGEDNWSSTCRWSPFQQMYRYDETSVIMLFNIPTADPWQYDGSNSYWMARNNQGSALFQLAQYRIPKSFTEIDTSDPSGKWVFARSGATMIAIGTLNGTNEFPSVPSIDAKYKVVKVRQAKTAIFWRVESGSDFEDFKVRSVAMAPVFELATNPRVRIVEKSGAQTLVTFRLGKYPGTSQVEAIPEVISDGVLQQAPIAGFSSSALKTGQGDLSLWATGDSYGY